MAITGVLGADFSAFVAEGKKAEATIKAMEGGAVKAEAALSNMSTGADQPLNTFRSSVGQVDQALSAAGINVGKYARGFAEITELSGKTVSQIGLLAAGAGVLAAAMAGWNFGRWIADVTGADKAIAGLTARVMGYGDVVAQTAGAKQDVINRAIANGAKETITYSEAIAFNIQHLKNQGDAHAVSSERLAAAQREVRGLSDATIAAIEIAQKNKATTEQITKAFGISADGLRALADRQKVAGQAADAHTKALEVQLAAVEKLDREYAKLMSDVKNANQLAIMEADAHRMAADALNKKNAAAVGWIKQQVAATQATNDAIVAEKAYLAEQDALNGVIQETGRAHVEAGAAAVESTAQASAGYSMLGQQVTITADAIRAMIELSKFSAASNAILNENSLFTSSSQLNRISQLGSFAGGGSGGTINNTFNVVDTEANIARRVSDQIMRTIRSGTQLGFA